MTKSSNKHNRIYCTMQPIEEELSIAIENKEINTKDQKERTKQLQEFGWDKTEANKIWAFAPFGEGANLILDQTKGCQYMNEIKEHVVSGFQIATKAGILCDEPIRGTRMNVVDTVLHNDSIHRGGGQISPPSRRNVFACQLLSAPTL